MKQDQQRAIGATCRLFVDIEEIAIRCGPALSQQRLSGAPSPLGVKRRPDGLGMSAWQPAGCLIKHSFSVQHCGFDPHISGIFGGARAGVVSDHAPALRRLVVNVCGNHISLLSALRRDDFHPFNEVVH